LVSCDHIQQILKNQTAITYLANSSLDILNSVRIIVHRTTYLPNLKIFCQTTPFTFHLNLQIMSKLHTILVFAQNKRGVLERITMLIRRKMYNLETITASDTEVEGIKRITITFSQGDADKIPQIVSQINKIVEVVEIKAVDSQHTVQREILLVKIARPQNLSEVTSLVDIFRGSVVDVSEKSVILQVAGDRHKTLGFLNALKQFQILEVGSSGIVAMEK